MSDTVGIDIGTYAIKLVAAKNNDQHHELRALSTVYNPVGQFLPSEPARIRKLAEAIHQAHKDARSSNNTVHLALPESLATTVVIQLPYLTEAELASSINWEAEQYLPGPRNEYNIEYEVLYRPKKGTLGEKMKVLLVATKKEVVDRIVGMVNLAGLEVVGLETGLLAVYRCLAGKTTVQEGAVMLCHMGALTTELLIIEEGAIVLTYSIQTGGLALTRAIEKGLSFTPTQSEEHKRAYGLDASQFEGKVNQVLLPVMDILTNEIRKAIQYYQTSQQRSPVRSLLLSGGGAYLPGITSYMTEKFGCEVSIAKAFEGWSMSRGIHVPEDSAAYSVALGLAMHEEE